MKNVLHIINPTSTESLSRIKEFADGVVAFANPSNTAVAIFADMGDGEFFNVSGWTSHPTKSLIEIADSLLS